MGLLSTRILLLARGTGPVALVLGLDSTRNIGRMWVGLKRLVCDSLWVGPVYSIHTEVKVPGEVTASRAVVSVIGQDRPGIVAEVSSVLAGVGANIEDISQTIRAELFAMIMLVTIDEKDTSLEQISQELAVAGERLGVQVQLQHEDIFRYMHRV